MSWSSAASRTTGRSGRRGIDGAQRVIPEVLARRSCSGGCRAGRRAPARCRASRPVSLSSRSPTDGARRAEQLVELGRDPLAGQVARPASARAWIAGQRRRLDPEARASPRAGRPGSSGGRPPRTALAGRRPPAARRAATSAAPSYGSTSAGVPPAATAAAVAPQAIALTVKSRRARSTSMVSPNSTRCGRRKSA